MIRSPFGYASFGFDSKCLAKGPVFLEQRRLPIPAASPDLTPFATGKAPELQGD